MLPSTGALMELLRGDQTTRRGVRVACGVIALATLALAACNNETQTGPGGANTLVFVGNVNGANASLAGSIVMTIDETRAAATFKVIAPSSDDGTGTGEDGIATIGEDGAGIGTGDAGTATGEGGTATGDAGISTGDRGTGTNEAGTANGTQTSTTLQDTTKSKSWKTDLWVGRPVTITAGTGAGQTNTVTSNTANTLTVSPWITTPDGTSKYVITQTSTALQDTSKSGTKAWTINQWAGRLVTITAGPGAGQTRTVSSNTTNTLTVSPAWSPIPDGTSQYVIGQTSTTLQDTTKSGTNAWTINQWANRLVTITAGAGAGQTSTVMSNTTNTLTVSPAWATTPDGTSKYVIKQTPTTFQDITKSWTVGQWAGRLVRINAGTGAGQTRTVSTNAATTLTVSPAWDPTPDGASEYVITQTSTTLRDTTKVWTTDQWAGRPVTIKAGSGAGQASTVSTNTGNTLTVSPAWTTTPDGSSEYVITQTSTTLQDITKSWTTDQWKNHKVSITAGTGAGQTVTVTSNTANTLTVKSAWTTKPDGSSRYVIGVGATATIALNGAYNSSSRAVSASGGGYAFDGTYDGSSRLEGTFTGPSSASGTFRSERATSNPMGYCGPFTSTTTPAGYNGIFNVTMSGLTLYGTATADNGTVFALDGTVVPGDNGVGTGAAGTANGVETSTTLQDTTQAFKTDQWAGRPVRITAGLGAGQIRTVVSKTATTLTVSPAWTTTPEDAASEYVITQTSTTFEAKKKTWTTDQWKNNAVFINAGAGAGQTRTVSSNTATTLTVSPAWDRNPDGTSQYVIAIGLSTGTPFPATGMGNSTISRLAGTFNDGAGNQGTWYGARCDQ